MKPLFDLLPAPLAELLRGSLFKRAYLVGGCVRDWLLGLPIKDVDIEVFDISPASLAEALAQFGKVDLVGNAFGVFKLTLPGGEVIDFSIPRRDSKMGQGHRGFETTFDSSITLQEAAERRDFTLNALLYDSRSGEVHDFFGGQRDLKAQVLRHITPAFTEDPLRVLRGMQFAGRFNLTTAQETLELCRRIKGTYHELPVERVREEWFKWARQSKKPSVGLVFLQATEWIEHFPEIEALSGTPQDPEWHPEGDVFVHTCHCCDAMAALPRWQQLEAESKTVYMLAILAHDFGKPETTVKAMKDGVMRTISPGHEAAGVIKAEKFLERINTPHRLRDRILPLVANHLVHFQPYTDRAIRRLARRLQPESISGLCTVMTADSLGRPPRPPTVPPAIIELEEKAHALEVATGPPPPILMGRHLLEVGMSAGPRLGKILNAAYEAQLEGKFSDLEGAKEWLATEIVTDQKSDGK